MSTYFCNDGQDLSKKIPLHEGKYSINPEGTQFHFQPVNLNQVVNALGKFKTSTGFGTDCIASQFFKIGLKISDSLSDISNLSIRLLQELLQFLGKLLRLPLSSIVVKQKIGLITGLYLFFLFFRGF